MTNLSKELCEVCGIEPIYETEVVDGWGNTRYKLKCKTPEEAEVKGMFVHREPKYPDFTQPENFLKLMELRVEGLSGGNLTLMGILNKEYWLSDRQDYIRFLCQYFIPDLTPYWQDKLKQAIRKEEWIYD